MTVTVNIFDRTSKPFFYPICYPTNEGKPIQADQVQADQVTHPKLSQDEQIAIQQKFLEKEFSDSFTESEKHK